MKDECAAVQYMDVGYVDLFTYKGIAQPGGRVIDNKTGAHFFYADLYALLLKLYHQRVTDKCKERFNSQLVDLFNKTHHSQTISPIEIKAKKAITLKDANFASYSRNQHTEFTCDAFPEYKKPSPFRITMNLDQAKPEFATLYSSQQKEAPVFQTLYPNSTNTKFIYLKSKVQRSVNIDKTDNIGTLCVDSTIYERPPLKKIEKRVEYRFKFPFLNTNLNKQIKLVDSLREPNHIIYRKCRIVEKN